MSLSTRISCVLSLGLLALLPALACAQAKKGDSVTFTTGDYAEIRGYWYAGPMGKQSPTVMLLHSVGSDCRKDGWQSLAEALNKKGFAVLAFDFRGHGRSTDVDARKFWALTHNSRGIKTFRPGTTNLPDTIDQGDFQPDYFPHLINDIYAAKLFIEERNDRAECNASQLILIGSEEGATLGSMFVAAECRRFKFSRVGPEEMPESRDILACVWLTVSTSLGKRNVTNSLTSWFQAAVAHKENKIPMVFLFGKEDASADNLAVRAVRMMKPGYIRGKEIKDDKYALTGEVGIEGSQKLSGSKLLSKDLTTEKDIVDGYLGRRVFKKKEKGEGMELNTKITPRQENMSFDWYERAQENNVYVFQAGRLIFTKQDRGEKLMLPVPLASLGLIR